MYIHQNLCLHIHLLTFQSSSFYFQPRVWFFQQYLPLLILVSDQEGYHQKSSFEFMVWMLMIALLVPSFLARLSFCSRDLPTFSNLTHTRSAIFLSLLTSSSCGCLTHLRLDLFMGQKLVIHDLLALFYLQIKLISQISACSHTIYIIIKI